VDPLRKLRLNVTKVLPSGSDWGVVLAQAIMIFLMVPETDTLFMLAPLNTGLNDDADWLNETEVESYSILRVNDPIFVKLVTVNGAVKVTPGHIVYVPIVEVGALVAKVLMGIPQNSEIRNKRIKKRLRFIKQIQVKGITNFTGNANISILL